MFSFYGSVSSAFLERRHPLPLDLDRDLVDEAVALGDAAAEGVDEGLVALGAGGLRGRPGGVRDRRVAVSQNRTNRPMVSLETATSRVSRSIGRLRRSSRRAKAASRRSSASGDRKEATAGGISRAVSRLSS
ncbi:hypothetical protein [Rhodoplanes sp. SY1]|uniref:hypothetical protein n=1 Tax=Rhodoplanes sp. SY1 TaxID=3166646 RepID=UPI0038B45A99